MRWLFIVLIILGVIFYLLGRQGPAPRPPAAPPVAAQSATPGPLAAPQAASTPVPPPLQDNAIVARMKAVARQTGVELRAYHQQPNGAMVGLAWTSDNSTQGLDFIEECRKQGIISGFDDRNYQFAPVMENGRRVFTARYLVYL